MHARDLSAVEAAALVEDVLGATRVQRPAPVVAIAVPDLAV
jgi:hypothetical protein